MSNEKKKIELPDWAKEWFEKYKEWYNKYTAPSSQDDDTGPAPPGPPPPPPIPGKG